MGQGPARAGFLGPGRNTLGAYFGRVDRDPQLARGSLSKTNSIVSRSDTVTTCLQKSKKSDALTAYAHRVYHCAIYITSHILPTIDRCKLHDVGDIGDGCY